MNVHFSSLFRFFSVSLLVVGFTSCASKTKDDTGPAANGVKLTTNPAYRSTNTAGPALRNPNFNPPSAPRGSGPVSISHGSRAKKYIALTFDDGPQPTHTPRLLDILKRRNVKATFYVIGRSVASHPSIVRRTVAEGHEIGNHTWSHPNLQKLSDSQVRSELNKTRDAIIAACGVKPRTMRPPYGSMSTRQRQWVHSEYGYPAVLWDVDPLDWKKPGSSVVASRLISGTKNGSILLVHDLHGSSVDAIPRTIDSLLRQGYQFVTVSQLIALSQD